MHGGFWPRGMQVIRCFGWAYYIQTALYDRTWFYQHFVESRRHSYRLTRNMSYSVDALFLQKLTLLDEQVVDEVVSLHHSM